MTATEKDLSLMKVHVFKTVDEYEAARSGGLIGGDDLVITPDTGRHRRRDVGYLHKHSAEQGHKGLCGFRHSRRNSFP